MAAISATGMQEHLEDLLSKTITLQPSLHVDRVYGSNIAEQTIAKQDARFIADSQQFVRSLGKHVHEGLDMVDLVQDIEFTDLPDRTRAKIEAWAQEGRNLSARWEKTIKDATVTVPEAQDMQELCQEAVQSLYHLERDIGLYADRPVMDLAPADFDEPLNVDDIDTNSHDVDHSYQNGPFLG